MSNVPYTCTLDDLYKANDTNTIALVTQNFNYCYLFLSIFYLLSNLNEQELSADSESVVYEG